MKRTGIRSRQAGFTMLELLVVVALIAALTSVALPSFTSAARRTTRESEVRAYFGELRIREESYMMRAGNYLSTGTTETDTFPAAPSLQPQPIGTLPALWNVLRTRVPSKAGCVRRDLGPPR